MSVSRLAWCFPWVFATTGLVFSAPVDSDTPSSPVAGVVGRRLTSSSFTEDAAAKANQLLNAGKVEECIAFLRGAGEKDSSLPPELLMLAYLYLGRGQWHEGQLALEKAATVYQSHPEVYQACGQFALTQGRTADAYVHLQQALRLQPPAGWSKEQTDGFRRRCQSDLARVAEAREDWAGLIAACAELAANDTPTTPILALWAKALVCQSNADAALQKLAAAHKIDPTTNPPEISLAALFTERGDFDTAKKWYETAIKKYPRDARVYFEYAGSLLLAGRANDAEAQLNAAEQTGVALAEQHEATLLLRGLIARSQERFPAAEAHFRALLEKSPGHPGALYHLPLVLVEQDDPAKKRQALQIALIHAEKNPGHLPAKAALGWVQFKLGQVAEAEASLRAAAADPAADGETLYFLAQILLANNKAAEAAPAIAALRAHVARPQLFILRGQAREWVESVSIALE